MKLMKPLLLCIGLSLFIGQTTEIYAITWPWSKPKTPEQIAADKAAADKKAEEKAAKKADDDKAKADKAAAKAIADKEKADKKAAQKIIDDKAKADKAAAKAIADKEKADKKAAQKIIDDKLKEDKRIANEKIAEDKRLKKEKENAEKIARGEQPTTSWLSKAKSAAAATGGAAGMSMLGDVLAGKSLGESIQRSAKVATTTAVATGLEASGQKDSALGKAAAGLTDTVVEGKKLDARAIGRQALMTPEQIEETAAAKEEADAKAAEEQEAANEAAEEKAAAEQEAANEEAEKTKDAEIEEAAPADEDELGDIEKEDVTLEGISEDSLPPAPEEAAPEETAYADEDKLGDIGKEDVILEGISEGSLPPAADEAASTDEDELVIEKEEARTTGKFGKPPTPPVAKPATANAPKPPLARSASTGTLKPTASTKESLKTGGLDLALGAIGSWTKGENPAAIADKLKKDAIAKGKAKAIQTAKTKLQEKGLTVDEVTLNQFADGKISLEDVQNKAKKVALEKGAKLGEKAVSKIGEGTEGIETLKDEAAKKVADLKAAKELLQKAAEEEKAAKLKAAQELLQAEQERIARLKKSKDEALKKKAAEEAQRIRENAEARAKALEEGVESDMIFEMDESTKTQ